MKRFVSMLLAIAMALCLVLPAAAEDLLVTATLTPDRETVSRGEDITLTLSVDNAVTHLTAWQFNVYFDSSRFTFKGSSVAAGAFETTTVGLAGDKGEGMHVPVSAISPLGLAVDLNAGNVCTFTFTANADAALGSGDFTLACIDLYDYDNYTVNMAGRCAVNSASVTVAQEQPAQYAVTVEGSGAGDVTAAANAQAGMPFTFTVNMETGYDYAVSAVSDGDAAVTNNNDGSFTIPEDYITAPVTITVTKTASAPAAYAVSVTGTGMGDVTAADTATAGLDFTFTVDQAEGFDYTVTAAVGDAPVAVSGGSGTYTISGSDITGSVTITVSKENSAPILTGYGIYADPEVQTAFVNEQVEVKIKLSSNDFSTFNAYMAVLSYDTDRLTLKSVTFPDDSASYVDSSGVITLVGFGRDKTVATDSVAVLTFTTGALGTAQVNILSANIDRMSNAPTMDTPAATVQHGGAVNITGTYKVTLGEGLTADETVATSGTDYTFRATDPEHYNYAPTAAINGTAVTVTDNGNGTFTIPGGEIIGEITVLSNRTPKSFTVTVTGSGAADVTAAATATYNTDYTFTVAKDEAFTYTVSAKTGDTDLSLTTGENGSYTLAGTSVTGNITITVDKAVKPITTYPVSKPDHVTGADAAQKGRDYTFSIAQEPGYRYGEPEVTVGGQTVTVSKNEDGSYTIPASDVTGDVDIQVERSRVLDVEVSQYLTISGKVMWLVTATGELEEGQTALYDGKTMFLSGEYSAYAWLVISDSGLEDMRSEAQSLVTAGSGSATDINYGGDVNMTGKVDVNDAQLVYDMYNAAYQSFDTVSMEKFLRADTNADRQVNTADTGKLVNQLVG